MRARSPSDVRQQIPNDGPAKRNSYQTAERNQLRRDWHATEKRAKGLGNKQEEDANRNRDPTDEGDDDTRVAHPHVVQRDDEKPRKQPFKPLRNGAKWCAAALGKASIHARDRNRRLNPTTTSAAAKIHSTICSRINESNVVSNAVPTDEPTLPLSTASTKTGSFVTAVSSTTVALCTSANAPYANSVKRGIYIVAMAASFELPHAQMTAYTP